MVPFCDYCAPDPPIEPPSRELEQACDLVHVAALPRYVEDVGDSRSASLLGQAELAESFSTAGATSFEGEQEGFWCLSWKEVLRLIGPGWLVAMAYVDPGNLEGDLLAGAYRVKSDPFSGYRLLWVLLWSTLMGYWFQRLSIQLGVVTGKHLASLCALEYPPWLCKILWVLIELCLVGADMQATIGSAIGLKLLFNISLTFGIFLTLLDTFVILLSDVCGTRTLESLFAILLSLLTGCFLLNMIISKPNTFQIISGVLLPSIPQGSIPLAVALIGSILMPHNLFLQSAVVQSRKINRNKTTVVKRAIKIYGTETFFLLLLSLSVNIAVVVSFANPKITQNSQHDLYNAHTALQGAIGKSSRVIWALGLLAAGQCSTMAGTYSGQFIMEGLLDIHLKRLWVRVIVTRAVSMVPLISLIWLSRNTVEKIANYVNILQALILPLTLLVLIKFVSSPEVMGSQHVISQKSEFLSYVSGALLISANVNLAISSLPATPLCVGAVAIYLFLLFFCWQRPLLNSFPS